MRQALGQRVSIARVDRGAVMRYGRWALMRPPCSAALMRPLCVRPECPAFLYPGVGAAGYSSQTHGDDQPDLCYGGGMLGSSQLGDAFALPGPQQEHGMWVSATLLFPR